MSHKKYIMSLSIDEKLLLIRNMMGLFVMTYSTYDQLWEISNRTDEGLGSGEQIKFVGKSPKALIDEAYDILNNGPSQDVLNRKNEIEKEIENEFKEISRVELRGNVIFIIVNDNLDGDPENSKYSEILDKTRNHPYKDYLEVCFGV
jgi:hypothetical protein